MKRQPRLALPTLLSAVFALLSMALHAQQPAIDTSRIGPVAGSVAPEFSGSDQFGRTQTLQSAMGQKGMMLVFFRSADW